MAKFKLRSTENINFTTPQEMFDDYKNRKIISIYDYQSKMIDLYLQEQEGVKDIALELPTGTGKTLVGLLIGEFRRRKNKEKILYLCPNKQLVNQTVKHSIEDYGIQATAFTGSATGYDPVDKISYNTAQTIAVTTYSSLFNMNPFFKDADIIIFDDAHSGENYITSNWMVSITKENDEKLFFNMIDKFKNLVEQDIYEKMLYGKDLFWFDKVPNIKLVGNYNSIEKTINDYLKENLSSKIKYSWSMIENNLSGCNIFISSNEIVIRPFIPPTLDFLPFKNAKQRIYMSATLGKSGELERAFGVPKIKKLPMVKDWENKTIGRRFFMFPFASFKEDQLKNIILSILKKVERTLLIVNDDKTQDFFKEFIEQNTNKNVFTARDIEKSKEKFVSSDNAVAIVANRFDGIDFPNDECRMEILFDLQNVTHIQEKFLTTRMCSMVLYTERIHSRLVQALGRCTRSNSDYAALCIVGEDLTNTLLSPKKIGQFNPEFQAELYFGFENSTGYDNIDEYLELLDLFLSDRTNWNEAEKDIINRRDEIIKKGNDVDEVPYKQLNASCKYEINAQYSIWQEDYAAAIRDIEKIFGIIEHESLRGYLGFWFYIAAYCAFNLFKQGNTNYKQVYVNYLKKASETTLSIKWFNKLIDASENSRTKETGTEYTIERIESVILRKKSKSPNNKLIFDELDELKIKLEERDGLKFEKAHEKLGKWMGYITTNPKGDSEPDPIWIVNSRLCIVSEDKIYNEDSKSIPTRHVREAAGHKNWIASHNETLGLSTEAESITVFITNSSTIDEAAAIHASDINYLNRNDFLEWAERCIDVLKELIITFNSVGDVIWRDKAIRLMTDNHITPLDYVTMIKKKKLESLTYSKNN